MFRSVAFSHLYQSFAHTQWQRWWRPVDVTVWLWCNTLWLLSFTLAGNVRERRFAMINRSIAEKMCRSGCASERAREREPWKTKWPTNWTTETTNDAVEITREMWHVAHPMGISVQKFRCFSHEQWTNLGVRATEYIVFWWSVSASQCKVNERDRSDTLVCMCVCVWLTMAAPKSNKIGSGRDDWNWKRWSLQI